MSSLTQLLEYTPKGLFCRRAGIFIDPGVKVPRAIITHAHSDHARRGHGSYACHTASVPLLMHRLGRKINVQAYEYGEGFVENGKSFSFFPSGHMPGSAQVRIEYRGEVWVVTGDFKVEDDGFTRPWEPVRCHGMVMESTFGLPVYHWRPQHEIALDIQQWCAANTDRGLLSMLFAYPFGKAQRLTHLLGSVGLKVCLHPVITQANGAMGEAGFFMPDAIPVDMSSDPEDMRGAVFILPPASSDKRWLRAFGPASAAMVSGWAQIRSMRSRWMADTGFVLSDHADWDGLNTAVSASGAEKVIVTHGYERQFAAWLRGQGLDAQASGEFGLQTGELHPDGFTDNEIDE